MIINSFQEYDSFSAQNRNDLGKEVEAVERSMSKTYSERGGLIVVITQSISDLGSRILAYTTIAPDKEEGNQSQIRAMALIMSNNISHLTSYGIQLQKEDNLTVDNREQLYQRFLGELGWVRDHCEPYAFDNGFPEAVQLLRAQTISKLKRSKGLFDKVLKELNDQSLITSRNQRNLKYLLFPPQKKVEETSPKKKTYCKPTVQTSEIIPEIEEPKLSEDEEFMRLGFLTEVFGLQPKLAQKYVKQMHSDELDALDDRLTAATGDKSYARGLVQLNPEILTYQENNTLTKYITTIKSIQEKIDSNYRQREQLEEAFGIDSNLREYSSLEGVLELKRKLFQQSGQYSKSKVNITVRDLENLATDQYDLLAEDEVVSNRLSQLIDTGRIMVRDNDYWSEEGGERGKSILIKLSGELSDLFSDLHTTLKPRMDIQQKTISISPDGQKVLNTVRLYASEHIE
jgi:hypothetical protein